MSLVAALVAGGLLGVRHAVETDHVAAVAALVDRNDGRPGLVGASWGVGHSLPVAVVGLAFLFLGIRLPDLLLSAVETVVGVVLVVLGGRLLVDEIVRLRHSHSDDRNHHEHLGVGSILVGLTHSHRSTRSSAHSHGKHSHDHAHGRGHSHPWFAGDRSTDDSRDGKDVWLSLDHGGFAVGAVHGLAGSGALVVALVAAAPSVGSAVAFLGGFSTLSVATMAVVSAVWGRALDTRGRRLLVTVAGVASIVVGVALLADVGGVSVFAS